MKRKLNKDEIEDVLYKKRKLNEKKVMIVVIKDINLDALKKIK